LSQTLEESRQTMKQANDQKVNSLLEQQQTLRTELTRLKEDSDNAISELIDEQKLVLELKAKVGSLEQDVRQDD